MRLLAAPDKFRGTATASEVCDAVGRAARPRGWAVTCQPLADGGEGTLEAFGGATRETVVTGPLGEPVTAAWRLAGGVAVVEAARANGLTLAGGAERNDPIAAGTDGVGELITAALSAGARRVLVGLGGSATTDGGTGAVSALRAAGVTSLASVEVCVDVSTGFLDAARVFAPQKGADAATVDRLTERLREQATAYRHRYGIDVTSLAGAGAAGGLAGGLAALGARITPGFDTIADAVGLDHQVRQADLVVTGEGRLDEPSFHGKVVGGVHRRARAAGVPVIAVVGRADVAGPDGLAVLDLTAAAGAHDAMHRTTALIGDLLGAELDRRARMRAT